MLSRIEKITGLGLLHDARANPNCGPVTLIYGENARGKSTLSALLRSVKTGDVSEVEERCTIGDTLPLSAKLKFDKHVQVELQNGAWTAVRHELLIFNSEFVHRNVYSGIEVTQLIGRTFWISPSETEPCPRGRSLSTETRISTWRRTLQIARRWSSIPTTTE